MIYNCTAIHFHNLQAYGEITQGQGFRSNHNYMGCNLNLYAFQKYEYVALYH